MPKIVAHDKLAGLDAPDGRSFHADRDGIVTVPDALAGYAERAVTSTPLFERYRRRYAGFDAAELAARRAAWERRRERGDAASEPA